LRHYTTVDVEAVAALKIQLDNAKEMLEVGTDG
jgi:hypothetical protein